MNCPVCRDAMIVLEFEQIEIDHCVSCGGIWLDSTELHLLLESVEERNAFTRALKKDVRSSEEARKCPICLKPMGKYLYKHNHEGVQLDQCERGHGLWFDRGELETVLQSEFAPTSKILKLFQDIFRTAGRR